MINSPWISEQEKVKNVYKAAQMPYYSPNPSVSSYTPSPFPTGQVQGVTVGPSGGPTGATPPAPPGPNTGAPDLSNPAKMTDYARSQGFGSWDEYQTYLSQHQGGGTSFDTSAYDPIFSELDRQLGELPSIKAEHEGFVGTSEASQRQQAEAGMESGLRNIEGSREEEALRSKRSLRDVAENARDILSKAANVWGGSSAVEAATAGISKAVGKQRGRIMENRDLAYSQLDRLGAGIRELYSGQLMKIETWKAEKMLEISQWIRSQETTIRGQKAEIQSSMNAESLAWARQQAAAIEQQAQEYAQKVEFWTLQRQADLEDYRAQLQIQSEFKTPGNYSYKPVSLQYKELNGKTYTFNPQTGELAPISMGGSTSTEDKTPWGGDLLNTYNNLGV